MIDDIIQEATEAEEQGRDAGYAVGELLRIINQQKAEIRELKRKLIDEQKSVEKIAVKYFAREEEIERLKLEIEILIRKKEALQDEIAEKDAEIERVYAEGLQPNKIFLDFVKKCEHEAYREFALKIKMLLETKAVLYSLGDRDCEFAINQATALKAVDTIYKELTEKNDKG